MMTDPTLDRIRVNIRVVTGQDSGTFEAKVHNCCSGYLPDAHVTKRPSLKHLAHRDVRDNLLQGTRVQSPVAS